MEKTIDLSKLIKILKKNLKWLIILPLVFLVVGMILTFFVIKPEYEASTQVLVNQKEKNSDMMAQQVQSNIQLVKTYSEIIKSPRILDKVSKKLNGKYSSKEISGMLTVNNQAESQIMNITVKSKNKKDAKNIANTIAKVFSKDADQIMSIDNVSILSKADSATKVSPKPAINAIISLFLGIIVALVLISFKEILDRRIKTEEEAEELLDLPVLGSIPEFMKNK
ncbi:Wzz/FepE/Etk N-terminal domain-containing protein [Staphylococcus carnosus]|uniref:Capsular polysaccharide synthesis enzyme Cap5A n=1 Tax=Staphylococcus carnosus (strain TM300) TaxID=396513 RepID=B9DIL0_STACT|nr:Wzz/FepE/Etk N-terminal domain-containing protein [Staphylococcus carnosus]QPT03016.1 capsule biosynthesis protein CapA [Staphylococcus carnosus]UQA68019.1 capsule biosynthesis protein CapA [Staphylococcus carnosus]UTB77162.1 capsule biosynthesis protein CapA [Staphylococcus carnosus]UTB86709.1 capsule biosynthesis protein CapA [Staphylococcus carnosus]UTB89056.1 capsule biosynthesis protein CapA [Staphylococcus carnosus]